MLTSQLHVTTRTVPRDPTCPQRTKHMRTSKVARRRDSERFRRLAACGLPTISKRRRDPADASCWGLVSATFELVQVALSLGLDVWVSARRGLATAAPPNTKPLARSRESARHLPVRISRESSEPPLPTRSCWECCLPLPFMDRARPVLYLGLTARLSSPPLCRRGDSSPYPAHPYRQAYNTASVWPCRARTLSP